MAMTEQRLSLERGPFDTRRHSIGDLVHVIDRLAGPENTERFALYAPVPNYSPRQPHPANSARPGDEWSHQFDPAWPVSRFRYVGLFRLVDVEPDGSWRLVEASGEV